MFIYNGRDEILFYETTQELAKMDKSATSFTGHQRHTQLEQGKEERSTPMKKEVKQDGTKREKPEPFLQLVVL